MTDTNQAPSKQFTKKSAAILSAACLLAGTAAGWSVHRVQRGKPSGAQSAESTGGAPVGSVSASDPVKAAETSSAGPSSAELERLADAHAAPLEEKLQSDPANPALLTSIGNIYYDAQQYPRAVDYYARVLKVQPSNASVRTDMGTAFWYMGNADRAIAEFDKALSYEPDNPNTLFNLGLVRWRGKRDGAGAIGDWQKLLATHPGYEGRDKVEAMMAEAKHSQP